MGEAIGKSGASGSEPDPNPLGDLDEVEDFMKARYPEVDSGKAMAAKPRHKFRDYRAEARDCVKEFYRLNHTYQTYEFVQAKRREFLSLDRRMMGIWEAIEYLNTLVDESDPDTKMTQLQHLLQSAEAVRRAGHPRWFILTALIHDLGKILCLWGEPQWAVVGDTFPVGCAFSDDVVYPEFFELNPDSADPRLSTRLGIYEEGCGLDNVAMSWGHDEFMYHVVKDHLPEEGLYMIRYHSFYAAHREGAYDYLMNDRDREMFSWVKKFNPFDLYSKADSAQDTEKLTPFYRELIEELLPGKLAW